MKRYDLKIARKPKTDAADKIVNPDDRPALRLYQSVTHAMRRNPGLTEEQAIALYNRPRGICGDCGELCKERARRCANCCAEQSREKEQIRRDAGKTKKADKPCAFPGCGAKFTGGPTRKHCDDHSYHRGRKRAKSVNGPKKAAEPKRKIERITLPSSWEKPLPPVKLAPAPKPQPVDIRGHKVTYLPPLPGRWD